MSDAYRHILLMLKKRSLLQSSGAAKKRRIKFWVKYVVIFVLFVGLVVSLSLLSRALFWKITTIKIEGNQAVSSTDIETKVREMIEGNYAHLFSKSNVFLYPKKEIEHTLLTQFKRLKSVALDFQDFNTIDVSLVELQPYATWCTSTTTENTTQFGSDCYLMDETGYIFSPAPTFSSNVYVQYYGLATATDPVGVRYVDQNKFAAVQDFLKSLTKLQLEPSRVLMKDDGELDVYIEKGAKIIIEQDEDLMKKYHNLDVLLHDDSAITSTKDFLDSLDYIDLRFGNKLFYKLKSATATTTSVKK